MPSAVPRASAITPHSLPNGFNYVRNSVKAVIDAYDGTMSFYVVDPDDPVIATYRKVFPELFSDASEMPDTLPDNLRYPEDLFRVQSDMYTAYHVTVAPGVLQRRRPVADRQGPVLGQRGARHRDAPGRNRNRNPADAALLPAHDTAGRGGRPRS